MSKGKSKEKKIFEKFFKLLGCEHARFSKHGDVWKHHAKNLVLPPIPNSPSDTNWTKSYKQNLSKILSPAFTKDEFLTLLEPLIKKRKVKYTDDGRIRLLRIEPKLKLQGFPLVEGGEPQQDLEEDLLYALLPPDTDDAHEELKKIIKEKSKK